MKNLITLIVLSIITLSCSLPRLKILPHEKAEIVAIKISEVAKDYCDPVKMKACAYEVMVKKAIQDVSSGNGEKAIIGSLACSEMAGIVVDALNEKTFIKQCGCDSSKIKSKVKPAAASVCASLPF